MSDEALLRYVQGRLLGLRANRYSWWTHWRELADYILPRRYKWLVTPNQMGRGSPINGHILDSTGTRAARNLSSGMTSGISSPTRPWFKLRIGKVNSDGTNPVSLWLAECTRVMLNVFQSSNFYNSIAQLWADLVVFGTASMLIYEDYEDIIRCYNPCAGEYYLDLDGQYRPAIFYREFVNTVSQVVDEFGLENCSDTVKQLYTQPDGSGKTREIVVAHAVEPNTDPARWGMPSHFKFVEAYWEWGGSSSPQNNGPQGFLRKKGYHEQFTINVRWDLVSNDPYGRSPGMDALPDVKQLQLETRRKAQGIDKGVNPPMVADIQLKNQPASLIPGGMTFVTGFTTSGHAGFAPAYGNWKPDISSMTEDLKEVRERIRQTFFNDVLQTMAALRAQTSSNVTATEVDATKAESLIMLGPVFDRTRSEGLSPIIERVFAICVRARLFPPPPAEIAGRAIDVDFVSMLALAQAASAAAGIERTLAVAGNLVGVDPAVMDNIDTDFALDNYSQLMNNDPRMIRTPAALQAIRQQRAKDQAAQQQAALAEQLAKGAKTLSETQLGGGQNALELMAGS